MRKVLLIALCSTALAAVAGAQVPTSGNVFFGYSYLNTDALFGLTGRGNLNGWEGSLEGKVLPWVGIVADFSGHYGTQAIPCSGQIDCFVNPNVSVHEESVLFGPRVSLSVGKIRPFAEALFGAGHISTNGAGSDTSFATAIGGGIDYKIIKPVAWRVQGDYVQTRFFGTTQNNVRVSTGIVLRF
jgi:opacity protein-like surface antigen